MTFTRIIGPFPTRAVAERARRWASGIYSFELRVHKHVCEKPAHRATPWLLVSTVTTPAEPPAPAREPAAAAAAVNGR